MSKAKEVAVSDVSSLPAHLQSAGPVIGMDNTTSEDLEIPQLKLLQSLSPECQEGMDGAVLDAKPGLTYNTTTGELLEEFTCVDIRFVREFAIFRKRALGGDGKPLSIEDSEEDAKTYLTDNGLNIDEYDLEATAKHFVQVVDETTLEPLFEAFIYMSRTRLKVHKKWNSQIAATGAARFGGAWKFIPNREGNTKGSWFSYKVDFAGWLSPEQYEASVELYNQTDFFGSEEESEAA